MGALHGGRTGRRAAGASRAHFEDWAARYLDCDPESRTRTPPGVKTPTGPFVEILRAWDGELAFDPGLVARRRRSCAASGTGS